MLIRSNDQRYQSKFSWDWFGFLLVTENWIIATKGQAYIYRR